MIWSLAYGCGQQQNWRDKKYTVKSTTILMAMLPGHMVWCASPDEKHSWLHVKPLYATIVDEFVETAQNTNTHNF